jgi:hypothetical protein
MKAAAAIALFVLSGTLAQDDRSALSCSAPAVHR